MLALIIILACTETGSYFLLKTTARFIPGQLTFQQFSGRLINNFSFAAINYKSKELTINTKHLHIAWSIWDLFYKKLMIDKIEGENINIYFSDSNNQAKNKSKTNFSWLSYININYIELNNINIFKNKQSQLIIQYLNLRENIHNQFQFKIISNQGEINGLANIAHTTTQFQWQAQAMIRNLNLQTFSANIKSNINFDIRSSGAWNGKLQKMDFHLQNVSGKFQDYPITGYSDINYTFPRLEIKKSQIKIGSAIFNIMGTMREQWNMNWQLYIPNLQTIFPEGYGMITSAGKIFGKQERPKIDAQLRAENIKISTFSFALLQGNLNTKLIPSVKLGLNVTVTKFNFDDYLVPKISLTSESNYQQNNLTTNFSLVADPENQINGKIELPDFSDFNNSTQSIAAKINFNFARLEKLFSTLPDVKDLSGKFIGFVNVSGNLRNPKITSEMQIADGSLFVNPLKAKFSEISANGDLQYPNPLTFSGHFKANQGEAKIKGTVDLFSENFPIRINIQGKDLQVMNLNEYKVNISPDIEIKIDNNQLALNGNIFIPYANINPKDFSETVTLPSEVVFVDQQKTNSTTLPTNLALNIKIKLGDHINLQYRNLKARLAGELEIHQIPDSPAKATGTLYTIDGSYNAYNTQLTIQNGRIIYTILDI